MRTSASDGAAASYGPALNPRVKLAQAAARASSSTSQDSLFPWPMSTPSISYGLRATEHRGIEPVAEGPWRATTGGFAPARRIVRGSSAAHGAPAGEARAARGEGGSLARAWSRRAGGAGRRVEGEAATRATCGAQAQCAPPRALQIATPLPQARTGRRKSRRDERAARATTGCSLTPSPRARTPCTTRVALPIPKREGNLLLTAHLSKHCLDRAIRCSPRLDLARREVVPEQLSQRPNHANVEGDDVVRQADRVQLSS